MLRRLSILTLIALSALTSPLAAQGYWPLDDALMELVEIAEGAREGAASGQNLFIEARDYRPAADTIYIERRGWSPYISVKTNMLYDVALIPNLAAEIYLGGGFSLTAAWYCAWWSRDSRHRYWRIYGGELNLRRYLGRRAAAKPLTGHHVGLFGMLGTYDFELGGCGYLSKFSGMAGVEYGYALPIAPRMNIDLSIGVGYLGGAYDEYRPQCDCYRWLGRKRRRYFGPVKAEVSLVWLIGEDNFNVRRR